jgi:hypothetical protein
MGDIPLIGIMVPSRKQQKKILQIYSRYKGDLMIDLFCFIPNDINWGKHKIKGVYLKDNTCETKMFRFPNAIYNRCYQRRAKTIRRLEKYIGENKCFNHITYFNKWRVCEALSSTELDKYIPKTWLYKPEVFMKELTKEKRLILKPSYGSLGKQIYLVELTEGYMINVYQDTILPRYTFNDKKVLFQKLNELIGEKNYIFQKVIEMEKVDGKIIDLRILVQKDINGSWVVTNGVSRVAPYNFFITNCCEVI